MRPDLSQPLRLSFFYLLFGAAWIIASDRLLLWLGLDPPTLSEMQSLKGMLFIASSGMLLFILALRHELNRQRHLDSLALSNRQLLQAQRNAALADWSWFKGFHWSAAALRLLGQSEETPHSGDSGEFLDWLHPADRPAMEQCLQLLARGEPFAVNVRLLRQRVGRPVWLRLIGDAEGPGRAIGTLQDISQQMQEQEQLRESELRLRQLFEQTPHIAVQGYDRQRRVIYWNPGSVRLYGYSAEQALGQRMEELILPAERHDSISGQFLHWFDQGTPGSACETRMQRHDGSLVPVYSSQILLRNLHNESELYCVDIDLSEQQRIHLDLQQSEQRYRDLVEHLAEVIFLTDRDLRLNLINPAWERLTGQSRRQSLGQPLTRFMPEEDAALLSRQAAAIRAGDLPLWRGECRLLDHAGNPRWVELALAAGDGPDAGLRGSIQDIHARHHARKLQQARNAVLDEVLGQLPLTSILEGIARRLEELMPELRVSIALLDDDGQLRLAAAPSMPEGFASAFERLGPRGLCTQALSSGGPLAISDLQAGDPEVASMAGRAGFASCWSLPFRDDTDALLGTFAVYMRKRGEPDEESVALLTEFTRLAGLAIQQQQREQARLESEQRFRATFEQAAVGIAQLSPDGHWLRVNERMCQMLGYSREALLQSTYQELSCQEDLPEEMRQAARILVGEIDSYRLEKRFLREHGALLWARLNVTLVRDDQRKPLYFVVVIEDISLRKEQEQALQQAATVFDSTHEAVAIVDARRRILTSNPAFCDITGMDPQQTFGQRLSLTLQGSEDRARYRELWHSLLAEGRWQGELTTRKNDGTLLPLWLTASRVRDGDPETPQYVLIFSDLSQTKESQARLAQLANFDPLTGLPNRLFAMNRLSHALDHARRRNEKLAVLLVDLDDFKTVNDGLGLPVGDELLIGVSRRLQERLRCEDTLARFGGDEFMVILEDIPSPEEAALIARALLNLFETPLSLSDGREAYLGGCIGISVYPNDGFGGEELIRNADAALNQAKAEGRNSYRYYTQALTERANLRLTLEARLRKALRQGEFCLHYQPLIDVASGEAFGVEALLRWESEDGTVSPSDFIPMAEETGLIIPIGAWVLREACRQAQIWRREGLPLQTLAVNLSPRQFRKADLLGQVREALHMSGLPAHCLELEITEGALVDDVEQARATLATLKQLGVQLAVDDFGTGYSSLGYLRSFPLDKLKIDQSFMRGVPEDRGNLEIVSTIIGLARNLELKILAEGVETPEQLATLRQLGCEQCQGYLFSRALPPEALPGCWNELPARQEKPQRS